MSDLHVLIDRQSRSWLHIEKYMNDRLTDLCRQLEGNLDEVRTEEVRGRIREIRQFLKDCHPPRSMDFEEFQGMESPIY